MAANVCSLSAVASDSLWITWRRRIERTPRSKSNNRMQCRCRNMLASPRRQLVVLTLLSLSSEVLPLRARAGSAEEEEGGLSGALKSLFDPNEKTQSGKVLPKAYLKSAREVVKTLRESLQEDTKDMAKFRRTADAAKESIRGYLNGGWRGQTIVSNEESYVMIEKAIRSLANFYSKAGPSAPLPEDVKAEILSNLSSAEQSL
ncbi:photosystem II D1 precursor processing protein PSB27-H2, chloroplastic isoform X1 [Henckelia pumila]|uniref:photosystem II D1 precursor processing protein PSB27-H2, chloroplastic isoform X1 n=1 Tax=Henckelia pumila TaxID=405737 RepID=UPI003C6E0877